MPYTSSKIPIQKTKYDRRIKLTDSDKEKIREMSTAGKTQTEIAKKFKVSRRAVSFVIKPGSVERNKRRREERGGWRQYYSKDKHARSVKEHRHYKQQLYKDGHIKE